MPFTSSEDQIEKKLFSEKKIIFSELSRSFEEIFSDNWKMISEGLSKQPTGIPEKNLLAFSVFEQFTTIIFASNYKQKMLEHLGNKF